MTNITFDELVWLIQDKNPGMEEQEIIEILTTPSYMLVEETTEDVDNLIYAYLPVVNI
jgi:hypothetical protein